MKIKHHIVLWVLGAALLALTGCEVIREEDRLIPLDRPVQASRTHVLVEFTGFRCLNCPTASETAESLQHSYGEQLIVVAMHPASNPFTQGLYDYTCPAADTYYRFCGGTAQTPFPIGNIDLQSANGAFFIDPSAWATELLRKAKDSTAVSIDLTSSIDTQTRLVTIQSRIYNAKPETSVTYWLVEDSVLGVQAMPNGSVNTAYYHRHLLRAALDSNAPFTLQDDYDPARCSVIAVVQDAADQHIIQAKQTHLIIQ